MYAPKLRELGEALRSLFSKPYTTKFPKEEYKPPDEYRGFPEYFEEDCVGCGTCFQVCPAGAIEMEDMVVERKRVLRINYASCIQCGQCEEHCITAKGIKMTGKYTVLVMDLEKKRDFSHSVEKELVLCEICGSKVACRDHLNFVKDRLGAKAYAHPNFLMETQKNFDKPAESRFKGKVRREDYIKEVCPVCRHKIVVEDEF